MWYHCDIFSLMTFTATFRSLPSSNLSLNMKQSSTYFYSLTFYDPINLSNFSHPIISPPWIYTSQYRRKAGCNFHFMQSPLVSSHWRKREKKKLTFHWGKSCWNIEDVWVAADVFFSKFLSFELLTTLT